jgi:hypothetical protein
MRYHKFKNRKANKTELPKELGDAQEHNEKQLVKLIAAKVESNKPVIVKKVKIEYIDTSPLFD